MENEILENDESFLTPQQFEQIVGNYMDRNGVMIDEIKMIVVDTVSYQILKSHFDPILFSTTSDDFLSYEGVYILDCGFITKFVSIGLRSETELIANI